MLYPTARQQGRFFVVTCKHIHLYLFFSSLTASAELSLTCLQPKYSHDHIFTLDTTLTLSLLLPSPLASQPWSPESGNNLLIILNFLPNGVSRQNPAHAHAGLLHASDISIILRSPFLLCFFLLRFPIFFYLLSAFVFFFTKLTIARATGCSECFHSDRYQG